MESHADHWTLSCHAPCGLRITAPFFHQLYVVSKQNWFFNDSTENTRLLSIDCLQWSCAMFDFVKTQCILLRSPWAKDLQPLKSGNQCITHPSQVAVVPYSDKCQNSGGRSSNSDMLARTVLAHPGCQTVRIPTWFLLTHLSSLCSILEEQSHTCFSFISSSRTYSKSKGGAVTCAWSQD